MRLDDPEAVKAQYATSAGLEARRSLYVGGEGDDPRDVAFDAVAGVAPRDVLEVGCGPGEFASRIQRDIDCTVVALDTSERMVELARNLGVEAHVGDVQRLPYEAEAFDCVVAAWMLYHVPDLDLGIAELARVLRLGGRLVAVTNSEHHLREARELAGVDMGGKLSFSRENGNSALRRHFPTVDRHDVDGWVTFPDREAVRNYISSMITEHARADHVREFAGPLRAGRRVSVFVADKAHRA
ncbi:MAG: class I SAM-dependent methyltransferase [Gaiellaceae bacterium]